MNQKVILINCQLREKKHTYTHMHTHTFFSFFLYVYILVSYLIQKSDDHSLDF